jgi:excisionase family DNA binding protein
MNENVETDRWLSIMEACDVVKVSRRTIYNWLKEDRLVSQRTAGGAIRIKESSLWGGTNRTGGPRGASSFGRLRSERQEPSQPAPSTPTA